MKLKIALAAAAASFMLAGVASQAQAAITVAANSATGAVWTLGSLNASDPIFLNVTGTPFLQNSDFPLADGTAGFGTNGAGVVTTASPDPANPGGSSNTGVGSYLTDGTSGFTYGALIATLTAGANTYTVQVFPTVSGNGLGSSTPTSTLSLPTGTTFGSLFGFTGSSSTNNFVTFTVDDTIRTDNSGAFSVTAAPEPGVWALMIAGLAMMGGALRLRRRQTGAVAAA